jgi:hypothetical protein
MSREDVYANADRQWSFFALNEALGVATKPLGKDASSLERWYLAVGATPIAALSDLDIATALRQRTHLPLVFPEALKRLSADPWVGRYPGELLAALVFVPLALWRSNAEARAQAIALARMALESAQPDAIDDTSWFEVRREIQAWLGLALHADGRAPKLTITKAPSQSGAVIELTLGTQATLGNARTSTLYIPDARLARTHVVFHAEADGVRLVAEAHDVTVNGERVQEAVLRDGDRIEAGDVTLSFSVGAEVSND